MAGLPRAAKKRVKARVKTGVAIRAALPYPLPKKLALNLARVRTYWEKLRRGENNMPFWDDVNLSSLPELSPRLILLDAFDKPQRFRLNFVGPQLVKQYGSPLAGKFADEMEAKSPFEYFLSQASATVERGAPSYYAQGAGGTGKSRKSSSYARLLLPMWGDGRISMLLGVID